MIETAVRAVFKDSVFKKSGKNKKAVLWPYVQAKSQGVRNASIIKGYTATTFSQVCDVMTIADNLGQPEKKKPLSLVNNGQGPIFAYKKFRLTYKTYAMWAFQKM